MTEPRPIDRRALALTALIVVQMLCAAFFILDIGHDLIALGLQAVFDWHLGAELLASVGLVAGIAVEAVILRRMLARAARAERAMGIAQGALSELMERYFRDWELTPAEEDVAAFTLKGFSIAEIAGFRGSADGTVKTHLNAIYRKAGVAGRGQFVSLLIEDLMRNPLVEAPEPGAEPTQPAQPPATAANAAPAALRTADATARRR
ncbi:MAG: helix-turn-helix transcriptional regulator [Paracoccaceae bacterium]|nr:helix-turn-helix transcriptional regulator [Paracoccaceae bacterium]